MLSYVLDHLPDEKYSCWMYYLGNYKKGFSFNNLLEDQFI